MNKEEIKGILEYLENDENYSCDCNDGSYYIELPYREAHELKECITNLLKENKELKEKIDKIQELLDNRYNYHCETCLLLAIQDVIEGGEEDE